MQEEKDGKAALIWAVPPASWTVPVVTSALVTLHREFITVRLGHGWLFILLPVPGVVRVILSLLVLFL